MKRFIRWWRALLALGSEQHPIVISAWQDPGEPRHRRAFFKLIDSALREQEYDRRRSR